LKRIYDIFKANQVKEGNIVRRNARSMPPKLRVQLEDAVKRRGFHMALIGDQYVIVCNPTGNINVIC
jgi:hypothetical protein